MRKLIFQTAFSLSALLLMTACGEDDKDNSPAPSPAPTENFRLEFNGQTENINGLYIKKIGSIRVDGNPMYHNEIEILSDGLSYSLDGNGQVAGANGNGYAVMLRFFSDNDTLYQGSFNYGSQRQVGNFTLGTVIRYRNGQVSDAPWIFGSGRLQISPAEDQGYNIEITGRTDDDKDLYLKAQGSITAVAP